MRRNYRKSASFSSMLPLSLAFMSLVAGVCLSFSSPAAAQPAGYSIVRGSDQVTSTNITGYPGMVVFDTGQASSVCESFVLSKPSRQMVRIFILPDDWASLGHADLGDYIQNVPGANGHDYGILWVGSNLDHDGNTGVGADIHWVPRGFPGHDVFNASGNIVKFGVDPSTGNFSWWDPDGAGVWRQGSPVPSGHTPYITFANSQDNYARPIPSVAFDNPGCNDADGDGVYDFHEEAGCENDTDCDDDGTLDADDPDDHDPNVPLTSPPTPVPALGPALGILLAGLLAAVGRIGTSKRH